MKTKKEEIASAIIRTITYSDIFNYPLTLEEISKFLVDESEIGVEVVQNSLVGIIADSELIGTDGRFYFLKGRQKIIETRLNRRKNSEKKLVIAEETANKLSFLPSVKMIAITGALAMENCDSDDDIDLMIITAENRLWLTRLIFYFLIPVLGIKKRRPKDKEVKDKICLNLFLEESSPQIQPKNLFFAHEICQAKPIFNRDDTYEKFLRENRWVKTYLPNAVTFNNMAMRQGSDRSFIASLLNGFAVILNRIAFCLQYRYMKSKITNEKISLHQAFFHPQNLEKKISATFEEKMKRIKMLDKAGGWLI